VTSPALQPTQCGASVVSFVVKKDFPVKNGRAEMIKQMKPLLEFIRLSEMDTLYAVP
jgi:hypothetical protein